jgi:chlorophyll(ide) b reductase
VADHLVPRIRQVPETSKALLGDGVGSSQYIRYLTQTKAYSQIFARLLTGQRKNRFVAEE